MKLRLLLVGCAVLASASATAGVMEGTVRLVMTDALAPDKVFVKINGSFSEAEPGCAYSNSFDFVFDLSTSMGKAWYPMLLAAQAAGTTVQVGGTNTCVLRAGYEDVRYVQVGT